MSMEDRWKELTPEQQKKARACNSPEELLELAKAEGYELSDEELEGVAGGHWACAGVATPFTTCYGNS